MNTPPTPLYSVHDHVLLRSPGGGEEAHTIVRVTVEQAAGDGGDALPRWTISYTMKSTYGIQEHFILGKLERK